MYTTIGMAAALRAYCQQAVRLGCSTAQPLPVPVQVCRPSLPAFPAAAASSSVETSINMQQRSCVRRMGGFMAPRRHLQHAADRSAVLANYVETDKRSSLPATASAAGGARLCVAVDVDEGEQAARGCNGSACMRAWPRLRLLMLLASIRTRVLSVCLQCWVASSSL
jgi:hypothetical protein